MSSPRLLSAPQVVQPMASSSTQPTGPDYTYTALVNDIIAHPLFPLVVKKVFDICQSTAFERSPLVPHFVEAEARAKGFQNFAEEHGLTAACQRCTSPDIFISAFIAALNQVNSSGAGENDVLRHTIGAVQTTFTALWTDPRHVGATGPRPVPEEVQRSGQIPREDIAPRPLATRQVVESEQPAEQPASEIQRRRATTRRALSNKAKQTLERWFQENLETPYPSSKEKEKLAALCEISLSSVNNWFGNKRMRVKRKMLQVKVQHQEKESISDKVLAPKSKWNAVVVSKIGTQAGRDALESATGASVPGQPILEGSGQEQPVLTRRGAGSSGASSSATGSTPLGESSDFTQSRRSHRQRGQPGPSNLVASERVAAPVAPPLRESVELPREGQVFSSQIPVGVPVLPRTGSISGQIRDGVDIYRAGHALPSQTQTPSFLPSTAAITGQVRDSAKAYKEGQTLPPRAPTRASILPSLATTAGQVQNSSAVYKGGPPWSVQATVPPLPGRTTTAATETDSDAKTRMETRSMRTRHRIDPPILPAAATLPGSDQRSEKRVQELKLQAQESPAGSVQLTTGRENPHAGSTATENRQEPPSQTQEETNQSLQEAQRERSGTPRLSRRTKRRKVA